jgi:hypothetical protein
VEVFSSEVANELGKLLLRYRLRNLSDVAHGTQCYS